MTNQKNILIKIKNVSKTYSHSNKPALVDVNLNIGEGEKVGLIGSNGSGKTTLLRLLMNFIKPDEGMILIKDQSDLEDARRFMGYVGESQSGLENFTPRELFESAAKMCGMNSQQAGNRARQLLEFSGLEEVANELIEGFSKGMAQRAFVGLAIVHDPEILLLDEPMSGLDQQAQDDVRSLLKKLANKTLVYASHNLDEIEEFTSSVIVMHEGKIVIQLNLKELDQEIFLLEIDPGIKSFLSRFEHLNPRISSESSPQIELLLTTDSSNFQDFIDFCKNNNVHIHRIRSRSLLEHIYHEYIST